MYASQALQPNTLKGQRENPVANCKKKNIQNRPTPKQLERSIIKSKKKQTFSFRNSEILRESALNINYH